METRLAVLAVIVISALAAFWVFEVQKTEREFLKAGYKKAVVPTKMQTTWVAPERPDLQKLTER